MHSKEIIFIYTIFISNLWNQLCAVREHCKVSRSTPQRVEMLVRYSVCLLYILIFKLLFVKFSLWLFRILNQTGGGGQMTQRNRMYQPNFPVCSQIFRNECHFRVFRPYMAGAHQDVHPNRNCMFFFASGQKLPLDRWYQKISVRRCPKKIKIFRWKLAIIQGVIWNIHGY